jgi:hypothetical protein
VGYEAYETRVREGLLVVVLKAQLWIAEGGFSSNLIPALALVRSFLCGGGFCVVKLSGIRHYHEGKLDSQKCQLV